MDKTFVYDTFYNKFNANNITQNRIKKIIKLLSNYKFERFLDIGCGDGGLTVIIKEIIKATEVYGIEISKEGSDKALEKGINCKKLDLDKDDLPFEKNYFDFVFCGEIIEHVFDTDKLLEEVYRVLKPNGKLLITTPNLASWHGRISLMMGCNPFKCSVSIKRHNSGKLFHLSASGGCEHIRFFTLKALQDLLKYNGFSIKKVMGFYEIPDKNINKLISRIVVAIDKFCSMFPSFATTIGFFCEKNKYL